MTVRRQRADIVKRRQRQATRIPLSLEHQWRHPGLDNSLLPMSRYNGRPRHLQWNGRPGCIFQIQMVDKLSEIVGVLIHVVALPTLARTSMATPVMGNHVISSLHQKQRLRVPGIGAQRPSMREGDDRSGAPVLVNVFISLSSLTWASTSASTAAPWSHARVALIVAEAQGGHPSLRVSLPTSSLAPPATAP
jgi:hypothetical protein